MQSLEASMQDYYIALRPLLPAQLENSFTYAGTLVRLDERFEDTEACRELLGYEKTQCDVLRLASGTMNLFYGARQAGVTLP